MSNTLLTKSSQKEEPDHLSATSQPNSNNSNNQKEESFAQAPQISLPKGGGAIKGIDEKFSVNAVNGTAGLSIPVPASDARGFSPSLQISYNSGSGNGLFGMGWLLNIGSVKRKTEK